MKEALKLALDALMENEHYVAENERHAYVVVYNKIIEKCKEALAQPVQEPWCMKMNRCTTKCEDCPDEPAQEPVAWMRKDATLRFAEGKVFAVGQPFYTTPQQHPWVGLTEAQFLEAVRLAENGNYLVAFVRIQEWLKELNT